MRIVGVVIALLNPLSVVSFTLPQSTTTSFRFESTTTLYAENGGNGSAEKKKVIVLGGDGFCGWPTSLHLSDQGHDVVIVDNLSRRKIDLDLGCDSLTPIASPEVRSSRFVAPVLVFRPLKKKMKKKDTATICPNKTRNDRAQFLCHQL